MKYAPLFILMSSCTGYISNPAEVDLREEYAAIETLIGKPAPPVYDLDLKPLDSKCECVAYQHSGLCYNWAADTIEEILIRYGYHGWYLQQAVEQAVCFHPCRSAYADE